MLWFRKQLIEETARFLHNTGQEKPSIINIYGSEGTGKSDFVNHLLAAGEGRFFTIGRWNFNIDYIDPVALITLPLLSLQRNGNRDFRQFLETFPARVSGDIQKLFLSGAGEETPANSSLHEELFLQFLSFAGGRKKLLAVFENVQQIDRTGFTVLENFLQKINHLPVSVIFTVNPDGPFVHSLAGEKNVMLSKLSIQEVERSIRGYFETSPVNARLITNHCYLKTGGNPLRIRFLLEAVYRDLLPAAPPEILNIKKLQKIRITGRWEDIFRQFFSGQSQTVRHLFSMLAQLDDAVYKTDLLRVMKTLKIPAEKLAGWQNGGLLREISFYGTPAIMISIPSWKKFLQTQVPPEALKDMLIRFSELAAAGKLKGLYRISGMLYETGELNLAVDLAAREAEQLAERRQISEAADRLYFLVRISHLHPEKVPELEQVLDKLGDLYLRMGAYENAFEIIRKLRELYVSAPREEKIDEKQWLDANIRMARALIAMDSFHEARYLIREMRIKEFCDPYSSGNCYELLGDIEANLTHGDYAVRNYREAMDFYREAGAFPNYFTVYRKLLEQLNGDMPEISRLMSDAIRSLQAAEQERHLALVLRDRIQNRLSRKLYREGLRDCCELRRILRRIYHPQLTVQLVFYLAEIYVRLGKWQLAISHLQRIIENGTLLHRPRMLVHAYLQLGLVFKEQAQYGKARRALETGMERCFRHGYLAEQNEIKLHLGHLFLLAHGLLRAREYLIEAHKWADRNQQTDVLLLAKLYNAYYEIKHEHLTKARRWLREAKKLVNLSENPVDLLNYLYYLGLWLLAAGRVLSARKVAELLIRKAGEIPRYRSAGGLLLARVLAAEGDAESAGQQFGASMDDASRWQLPQIQYLLHCERVKLARQQDSADYPAQLKKACRFIRTLADRIEDEILRTQFLEARYHETILRECRENNIEI